MDCPRYYALGTVPGIPYIYFHDLLKLYNANTVILKKEDIVLDKVND